jgi:hypothetical protein
VRRALRRLVEDHFCRIMSPFLPRRRDISWGVSMVRSLEHDHSHEGVRKGSDELRIIENGTSSEIVCVRVDSDPSH